MSAIDTAIVGAITDCLRLDSKVVAFECDLACPCNFLEGLRQEFGDRVRIYNGGVEGITGLALGAAIAGLRPVLKLDSSAQFVAAYQFFSDIVAKLPTISNANLDAPLVAICPSGPGLALGIEHDNALESLAAKIDGFCCYFARGASDIAGLLTKALSEERPALILYSPLSEEQIDSASYNGKDLTVIAWGHNYNRAQMIAKKVFEEQASELTVLNLQNIAPLDKDSILKAVSHTHRVVIISDGTETSSFGSELAAFIQKEALDELDAPVIDLPFWYSSLRYLPSFVEYDESFTEYCLNAIKGILSDRY